MTKIDIFSGFLGAGKTTLIKKLIKEAYAGEKVVLIENEFGEIGIDGGFLADAGIEITEMNSGCICCSLVGDFSKALVKVLEEYTPDRIIIEPSGVGKLSDVIRAAKTAEEHGAVLNCFTTVADVNKVKMYMKNFGEFYNDQIANASAIVLSHTQSAKDEKIAQAVEMLREHNAEATIVTTPWDNLDGKDILAAMEQRDTLADAVKALEEEHHHHHDHDEECHCHEHEHHHDHDEECHCHEHEHHHDHGEECHCHEHEHHHDHGEECHCHEHEHHHDHDEECSCGCGGHGHHHHHHADDVFASVGAETTKKFTKEELEEILEKFSEGDDYGMVLRAKGIVECKCGKWLHFDYIPGEADIRIGSAGIIGRLCVIGAGIDKEKIKELFGI
ncbi:MAG: GTP-binding protein [Clostridia bacterium]|nr:GTP-binding protein [Clostridia bacterium]